MQQCGGLVSTQTFRSIENDEEALTLMRLHDRESLDGAVTHPEMAALEMKLRECSSPLEYPELNVFHSECFEVVDEYARALRRPVSETAGLQRGPRGTSETR
jgi:hypothetical protein